VQRCKNKSVEIIYVKNEKDVEYIQNIIKNNPMKIKTKTKICEKLYTDMMYITDFKSQKSPKELIDIQLSKFNITNYQIIDAKFDNIMQYLQNIALNEMKENSYDCVVVMNSNCELKEFPFTTINIKYDGWNKICSEYAYSENLMHEENNYCFVIKKIYDDLYQ
jgi:hypothetical protein